MLANCSFRHREAIITSELGKNVPSHHFGYFILEIHAVIINGGATLLARWLRSLRTDGWPHHIVHLINLPATIAILGKGIVYDIMN